MTSSNISFEIGCVTRLGNRATNQDRCDVVLMPSRALLVLGDGLGGHPRGELASQVYVETLAKMFQGNTHSQLADPSAFLSRAIKNAHDAINRTGVLQHPPVQPCTTAVAALVQGNAVWWSFVGDSRFYLLRQGATILKSRDHSYVEELYRTGQITNQEKLQHPMRNLVNRCLGGVGEYPEIESGFYPSLKSGDIILLCSDGLWGALDDRRIAEAIQAEDDLQIAVRKLARYAEQKAAPSSDNIAISALRWIGEEVVEQAAAHTAQPQIAPDPLDDAISALSDALQEYGAEMDSTAARPKDTPR